MADLLDSLTQKTQDVDLTKMVELEEAGNKGHPPSDTNRAAYSALMSDVDVPVETFRQVTAELEIDGRSRTADQILDKTKLESFAASKAAAMEFLSDPNYTDEERRSALLELLDRENRRYSSTNMLSTNAVVAEVRDETLENETTRINLSATIEEVNEYKRQAQHLLNKEVARSDPSMLTAYLDIVEFFLPAVEQQRAGNVRNALISGEILEGEEQDNVETFFSLLGNIKGDIRDVVKKLPVEERFAMAERVVSLINQHDRVILSDENDYSRLEFLKTVLETGYYKEEEEFLDNIVSVLDMVGIGSLLDRGVKFTKKFFKAGTKFNLDDFQRAWSLRNGAKTFQPTSVAENVRDVNSTQSRTIHEATRVDETGEMSHASYGVSREDAIAGDILPEITTPKGSVRNRTHNPQSISDQEITPDPKVLDIAAKDGGIYYFENEKRQMRSLLVQNFEDVKGVRNRGEMTQVGVGEKGGLQIKAVYGGANGGSVSASSIFNRTKRALSHAGVTDDEITILKRNEVGEYLPVKGIPPEKGDYLAQVDYNYAFNPIDVDEWSKADVKFNLFDRVGLWTGGSSGSFQRHMVDAHSMLHPNITLGANVVVDKAAGLEHALLDLGKKFGDVYNKIPKSRRGAMEQYIKEANYKGIVFNEIRLKADGFTPKEIGALKDWKTYWDTMYWLENKDLVKTLRSRGFEVLEDAANDTRLFARRITEGQANDVAKVYDPSSGIILDFTSKEGVATLYAQQGTVAKLRSPIQVGEQAVDHIVVFETSKGARLRALRDGDKVLNYRHGYYTVSYKAPQFIVENIRDSAGNLLHTETRAVAGDTPTAQAYADDLSAQTGGDYFVRGDVKKLRTDSQDYWDLQSSGGRISQRARGQRLVDASGPTTVGADHSFVMGPIDSMVHAARSTSARIEMRSYLEATKQRFLSQYRNVLGRERGMIKWPASGDDIKAVGLSRGASNKEIGDALTTYEYIRYMENGYRNVIDDALKFSLQSLAELVGEKGFGKSQRFINSLSGKVAVTHTGKNVAFQSYLALNPMRQFVVQGHQSTLLTVNFPKYVLSQRLARDTMGLAAGLTDAKAMKEAAALAGRDVEELRQMVQEFRESGLLASVDKQNLVAGALTELAESSSRLGKTLTARAIGTVVRTSRQVGFDAGETINIMTSWLAHRDQLLTKLNKKFEGTSVVLDRNLTQEELDLISAKARNYTFNMNAAGDMPYNQNALALLFQFMQVPHKALLQLTNRVLTRGERARLFAYQIPMFTLPPAAMYGLFSSIFPDNEEARNAVVQGIEGYTFNKLASIIAGEESRVDFSSLAPLDMYGTYEFIHALATTDAVKMLSESPSGQLILGNNPRITNAFKTAARFFGLVDDYDTPTSFKQVMHEMAKISSGYSNGFKAVYAFNAGQKLHGMDVIDPEVTSFEAVMQLFGFATMDEVETWYLRNRLYVDGKDFEKDVKSWYKDLKKHVSFNGVKSQSHEFTSNAFGEAWRVFGLNDVRAREIIFSEIRKDMKGQDGRLFQGILRTIGWQSQDEIRGMINSLPNISEEERKLYLGILANIDSQQELEVE